MSTYTFGFIGTGSMGSALARASARSLEPEKIILSNRRVEKAEALAQSLQCAVGDNQTVATEAKYIFLGVKPQMMEELLLSLWATLAQRQDRYILVTMAAGITMEGLAKMAGNPCPVIRIMPNTPCAIGEGVVLYDANEFVTEEELEEFTQGLQGAGLLDPLEERLIDAGSTVAGCGPAFLFPFIEALADGGVYCGLPREKALRYAAQMAAGSAKLLLETGDHPGLLKDQVCSPGGTTIAGVRALERGGLRSAAMEAVIAAVEKTKELTK